MPRAWVDNSQPRTLVEVGQNGTTGYYASTDVSLTGQPYSGRLVAEPEVRRRIVDVFWGPVEVQDASVTLANGDGALTAIYQSDLRGQVLVIKRMDLTYSALVTEWIGTVEQATLTGDGTLEIQGTNLALDAFDWDVPFGEITTADFPLALDVGRTVPVVFGDVPKVLLPCVRRDTTLNQYDYVVRGGTGSGVSFSQLWRDGPNDSLAAIGVGEYTPSEGIYAGYLCARFPLQQINFQGGPHRIYADVHGYQTERNFVRAVQRIMSDPAWSIGAPIDTASFDAAASAIAPLGLLCDGALVAPRKAKDWLRQLLMVRGMRLQVSAAGLWQISVDTQAAAPTLILGDGQYAGERNVLSVGRRTRVPQSDRPYAFTLRYRQDLISEEWLFRQSRWQEVAAGAEIIDDSDFVRDHLTADKVCDYRWKRLDYGQETIEGVEMTPAARELTEGQLVRFTYAPVGYTDETLEVREVSKGLAKITATLARWDASIYTHTPGPLPTDNISGAFTDLSRTPPGPVTAMSIVGAGTEIGPTGGNEAWTTLAYTTPVGGNCVGVRIDYKKDTDTPWAGGTLAHGIGANLEHRVRGLVPGLSYQYRIVALNAFGGASTPTILSAVAGLLPAPGLPTAVSIVAAGTEIGATGGNEAWTTIQYTTPATNCVGVTIGYKKLGDTIWAGGALISGVGTNLRHTVRGLVPALSYDYQIIALDSSGNVSAGVVLAGQVAGNLPTPADPTGAGTFGSGTVVGTDGGTAAYFVVGASAPASNVTGFRIDVQFTGSGTWTFGVAKIPVQPGAFASSDVKGLTPGRSYAFRIASTNGDLASPGVTIANQVAPGDTTAPGTPSTPTITPGPTHVLFSWSPNGEADIQSYQVEVRTGASGTGTVVYLGSAQHTVSGTTYVTNTAAHTNFAYGTTYHVRVRAVDYTGNLSSQWSASASWVHKPVNTPDIDPAGVSTSFSASAGSTGSFAIEAVGSGIWKNLNNKPVAVSYSTSQLFAFGWAQVSKTSAGDVIIGLRVIDQTANISGQPVYNILWGGGNYPITPLFCGVFDPSMAAMTVGTHSVILQVKGEGTAGQFFGVDASILETWEQRR
jgi:hypothetical protein